MGIPVNDPKLKKLFLCIFKEMGFLDNNGKLRKKTIEEAIGGYFGNDTSRFCEECNVDKDTPADTALHHIQCFIKWEQKQPVEFGSGSKIK